VEEESWGGHGPKMGRRAMEEEEKVNLITLFQYLGLYSIE
jgi:hypothetical protein